MGQTGYLVLFAMVCILVLWVLSGVIRYGFQYAVQIRRVKMEIGRAQDTSERIRWCLELKALRMCVVWGMSLKRAKAICKRKYR